MLLIFFKKFTEEKKLMTKSKGQTRKFYPRSIFTTNNAIWFEKRLKEKNKEFKTEIPVKFDINSTKKTIEWLKKQKLSWVVYQKEIDAAIKYNHYWASISNNGEIIGCIKIGFGNIYIFDYDKIIKFPDKMAFVYDTFVLDEYRNKGIAKYLISQTIKLLKSKGYERVGCHIPPWNKASISAFEKNGFKKVSYIRYFRILSVPIRIVNSPDKSSIFNGGKVSHDELPYT